MLRVLIIITKWIERYSYHFRVGEKLQDTGGNTTPEVHDAEGG